MHLYIILYNKNYAPIKVKTTNNLGLEKYLLISHASTGFSSAWLIYILAFSSAWQLHINLAKADIAFWSGRCQGSVYLIFCVAKKQQTSKS